MCPHIGLDYKRREEIFGPWMSEIGFQSFSTPAPPRPNKAKLGSLKGKREESKCNTSSLHSVNCGPLTVFLPIIFRNHFRSHCRTSLDLNLFNTNWISWNLKSFYLIYWRSNSRGTKAKKKKCKRLRESQSQQRPFY